MGSQIQDIGPKIQISLYMRTKWLESSVLIASRDNHSQCKWREWREATTLWISHPTALFFCLSHKQAHMLAFPKVWKASDSVADLSIWVILLRNFTSPCVHTQSPTHTHTHTHTHTRTHTHTHSLVFSLFSSPLVTYKLTLPHCLVCPWQLFPVSYGFY